MAGYDWSQFVADMGGSVGFLLGLSIIAVIVVLEKILGHLFLNDFIERYKEKKKKRDELERKYESEKTNLKFWLRKLAVNGVRGGLNGV